MPMRTVLPALVLACAQASSCCPKAPAASCPRPATCPAAGASLGAPHLRAAAAPPAADMVRVPAGEFLRGSPPGVGLVDERPQRRIHLSTFDIDRREVTVAEYDRCVKAGTCAAPRCTASDQQPERRPKHPAVCIPWEQARRYCAFVGKRLPTEAEWEKAARGTDGRLFPWGNDKPTCALANYSGCQKPESTLPAGSLPKGATPYGALDLAGNVWEWVADWHHAAYYTTCPPRDPPGPFLGEKKVVRGGAFSYAASEVGSHGRTYDRPTVAYNHVGFRCARSIARP